MFSIKLTQTMICGLCGRDMNGTLAESQCLALFGAKPFHVCPCCKRPGMDSDDPEWQRSSLEWRARARGCEPCARLVKYKKVCRACVRHNKHWD